ncbi:MAG TPA: bacillithiol biosynthesis deacetylase BshB1 [Thermoanaerobaculia bacterium]|nr:bacillithiol biosynthesis deacetylase BshB1 [Thermoanaerobaculia bacterium]
MTVDVLAIGAHPDDVELGCGGTLLRLAQAGRATALVSLTRGEAGTLGTEEQRRREAEAGAERLGASEMVMLDCGDGGLRCDESSEDALIAEIRRLRPRIVLGPPSFDRHPDHERAHRLVRDCCYYAGLKSREAPGGEPHRPGLVLWYMLHDPVAPTLVVDVTSTWERKLEAVAAHRSQFPAAPGNGASEPDLVPATRVSSRLFWDAIEGRARHFGLMIGVERGEPFVCDRPLAVDDLLLLAPVAPEGSTR